MHVLKNAIKNPKRFADHFFIKFLNKKIDQISLIDGFFNQKKGIEIGGPSKIFSQSGYIPIYPIVDTIDGVNFSELTVWENTIVEGKTYDFGGAKLGHQFIKDGTDLTSIDSQSYDFVLSSHSLEHIANPLKALTEWLRVLKSGGVLLLILPDSEYTFDCRRPITKFEHLLDDYKNNTTEKDLTHLEEIMSLHDLSYDPGVKSLEDFRTRSDNNFANRCLHHHVFDLKLMEQIFDYFNLKIILKEVSPPFNLIMMGVKLNQ